MVESCSTMLAMFLPSAKSLYFKFSRKIAAIFRKFYRNHAAIFPNFAAILPQYLVFLLVVVP
jgi:hypothetical protein